MGGSRLKNSSRLRSYTRFLVDRLRSRSANRQVRASNRFVVTTGRGNPIVAVYFADRVVNAYQLRQWLGPLEALAATTQVVLLFRNAETVLYFSVETDLPIVFVPTIDDAEQYMDGNSVRTVLYVNQNLHNFQMLRFGSVVHAFMSHGESEKSYMWSNQLRAYDFVLAAGSAARERLQTRLRGYDSENRVLMVGRPQLDHVVPNENALRRRKHVVLYAPTWEGDRASMRYSSVLSHGVRLVECLMANPDVQLVVRPHPRTGLVDVRYKAALSKIRQCISRANASLPMDVHSFDDGPSWGWQLHFADQCVTDISAVAFDWLATKKPLIVTDSDQISFVAGEKTALGLLPRLTPDTIPTFAMDLESFSERESRIRSQLASHHYGDTSAGASTRRFVDAVASLVAGTEFSDVGEKREP